MGLILGGIRKNVLHLSVTANCYDWLQRAQTDAGSEDGVVAILLGKHIFARVSAPKATKRGFRQGARSIEHYNSQQNIPIKKQVT